MLVFHSEKMTSRQVELSAKRAFVVRRIGVASLCGNQTRIYAWITHQVYVNRTRPRYTYPPGAFASSVREEVPTLSLHTPHNSFNGYHTRLLDARGYFDMLYRSINLAFALGFSIAKLVQLGIHNWCIHPTLFTDQLNVFTLTVSIHVFRRNFLTLEPPKFII